MKLYCARGDMENRIKECQLDLYADRTFARWIRADNRNTLDQFVKRYSSSIAEDCEGDPVFLARSAFDLEYTGEHNKDIFFADVKDIYRRKHVT